VDHAGHQALDGRVVDEAGEGRGDDDGGAAGQGEQQDEQEVQDRAWFLTF
jgi:hypothetical protein